MVGPSKAAPCSAISVASPGSKYAIEVLLVCFSRKVPPPLPGDFDLGEWLYYVGNNETFEDGDSVTHGKRGEVVGPATLATYVGKGLKIRFFPGNKIQVPHGAAPS